MKALSRNSKWNSKKYSQELAENNWRVVTPTVEASHKRIILESESTSSQLVSYQNLDVQSGDKLLVKLSDNNYHEVTVESVSSGTPAGTVTYPSGAINNVNTASNPYWSVTGEFGMLQAANVEFSEDGLTMWSGANTTTLGINQYSLTTPFDISTLSYTGHSISAPGYSTTDGWFFSNDGRYLYMSGTTTYVYRYTLAKPFDISTVSTNTLLSWFPPGGTTAYQSGFHAGAISEDGTKMMTYHHSDNQIRLINLSTPFDPSSSPNIGTNITLNTPAFLRARFDKKGQKLYGWTDDQTNLYSLNVWNLPAPFDISSYTVSTIFSNSFNPVPSLSIGSTANNANSRLIWSPDFRNNVLLPYQHGAYHVPFYMKVNTPTLIDISTEGLTEVPSEVLLINNIKTNISVGPSVEKVSCVKENLWLEYSTATTSSAVVGHIESGKLSVGDTIIIDGTEEVVLTGVTETLNGLPYISIDEPDGNKYLGVASVNGGLDSAADYYGYSPKMTFSPDGTRLFVIHTASGADEYDQGLTCYSMTTPWDINTLVEDPRGRISQASFGFGVSSRLATQWGWTGIQFSPDGLKMFVFASSSGDMTATQCELSVAWDPYSITSSLRTGNFFNTSYTQPNNRVKDMYMTSDGNQVVVIQYVTSTLTTNTTIRTSINLSSPWDLSGWPTVDSALTVDVTFNSARNEAADGAALNYRGVIERFNSDKSIIIYSSAGGKSDGFGTQSLRTVKNGTGYESLSAGVALDQRPSVQTTDAFISTDGTRFYLLAITGNLYMYQIRAETLQKYEITYPAQGTVPTSIHIKERNTALQLSPTVTSINSITADVTWSGDPIEVNARAIQVQVEGAGVGTSVSTVRLDIDAEI